MSGAVPSGSASVARPSERCVHQKDLADFCVLVDGVGREAVLNLYSLFSCAGVVPCRFSVCTGFGRAVTLPER